MKTITLIIDGMACSHCTASVTAALTAIDGVESATVSLEEKSAVVAYDADKVTADQLADTVDELGFAVIEKKEN